MPRKKRERLDISSTGVKSSAWPNSSTTTTTTVDVVGPLDRDRIFQQVKEMFHGQIDPEVIQIVLSEYNWQVENTLDALFNMTGEQPSRITEPSLDDDRISLKSIASNFYNSSPINASSTMTNSVSAILPGQNDDISSLVGNEQNFGCGYFDSYYFENYEFDLDYTALMSTDQQQTEVIQSVGNGSSAAPKSNAAEIQRPINESPGEEYTQSLQYEDDSGAFPLRDSLSSNQPSSGKEDCLNLGARKNVVRGKKSAPIAEKSAKITYNPLIMTEQSSSKSSPLNSSLDGLKNVSKSKPVGEKATFYSAEPFTNDVGGVLKGPPPLQRLVNMDSLNSVLGSSDHCRNEQTNNELEREIDLPSVENSSAVSSGEIGSSLSTTIEFVEVSPIFSQNTACSNGKEQRVSQAKPLPVCEGEKVFASSVSNCDDLKNSTDANFKKNSSDSNSSQQLTEIETSSTPPQEISKASLSIDAPAFVPRPSGNHNDFIVPTFQTASRPDRKHSSEKAPFFNPPTILKPSLYHQKYTNNFGQMPKRSFASLAGKMKEQPTMNSRTISNRKDANNDMYKKRLIEKVAGLLKNKKFVLIMMRGCPGSGKSTLARSLQFNGVVLSTDDYFMTDNGTYSYDREKLSEAHEWNQRRAQKAFLKRTSPVIIDNTNVKAWEMKSYVDMGVKNGYHVELVEPNTPWKFKPKELARLNSHGVDKMTIQRMVWLYDHNVTVESILGMPLIKKSSTSAKVTAFPKHRKTINCPPDRNHIAAEENLKTTDDKRSIENSDDISRDEPSKSFDEIKSVSTTAEEDDIIVLDSCSLSSDEVARDIAKPVQSAELPDDVSATVALESAGISFEKDDAVIAPVDDFIFDKSKLLAQEGSVRSSFESFVTCEENASLTDAVNVCDESISPDVETNAGATKKEDLPDNISVDPEVKPCLEVDSSEESQADEISLYYDAECDEVCQETNQLDTSSHQILSSSNNTAPGFEVSHESKKPSATDIKATEGSVEIEGEIVSNYSIEQNVTASESDKNDDESSGKKISLIVPTSLGLQLVQQYDDDDSEDDDVIIEEDSTVEIDDISDESHKVDPVEFEIKKDLIEKDRKDTEGENDRDVNYSKQRDAVKDEYGDIATAKDDIEIIEVKRTEIKEDSSLQSDIMVESPVSNENSKNEIWVPEECFWIEESTSVKSYRDFSEAQYWKGVDETKSQVNEIPESQSDGWATWTHQKTDQKENMNSESPKQRRTPRRKSKRKDEIDLPSGLFQCPSPDWSTLGFQTMTTNVSSIIPISSMVDTPVISTKDADVFTAPEDFALVYRILAGKSSNHGLPIVTPSRNLNVAFSDEAYSCNDYPRSPSVCKRATFDKSCSTDDLLIESNESKLIFLKSVFPHITEADLLDLLIKCDSNAEWAVDLLLDSAIEYNDCNPAIRLETSSQIEDLSPTDKMASLSVVSVEGLELMKSSEHLPATPKHSGKLYGQYSCGSTPLRESVDRLTARSHSLDKLQDRRGNVTPERSNSAKHQNIILQPDKVDDYSQEKPSFSGRLPDPCLSSAYHNNAGSVDYKDPGLPRTSGGEFSLELHLDPQTARKLMGFFGPVGFQINPGSLSTEDLCVKMSQSFARQLHRAWSKSIRETFVNEENEINELIQKDEVLAQKLQAEEDKLAKLQRLTTSATTKNNITPTLAGVIPLKISSAATSSKSQSGSQFQHIMDEQMALELTKEDYIKSCGIARSLSGETLATKLKRQKLYETFPKIDQEDLDEIYQANNHALGPTVQAIKLSCGMDLTNDTMVKEECLLQYEQDLIRQAQQESLKSEYMGERTGADEEEMRIYQEYEEPDYIDFRAEATLHYKLRHECFQKAQTAYRNGQKQVAAFYSQQGHRHNEKFQEANRRAFESIMQYRNSNLNETNQLDLHGLHANEAVDALKNVIACRTEEISKNPGTRKRHLTIITGRGLHSRGGIPKVKPAILNFLKTSKYKFQEVNDGLLKVTI